MYLESLDPESGVKFNPLCLVHLFTTLVMRQVVISVKYGLFSADHMKLVCEHKLNADLNSFDLIAFTVSNKALDILWLRLGFRYEDLQICEDEHYF